MPTSARAAVERLAQELLRLVGELADPPALRVAAAAGRVGCLIQVWDTAGVMSTATGERRRRPGQRAGCRADVLAVVGGAGRPLTRKEVMKALQQTGKRHGPSTVAKALAELTRSGELVNPRDKKGYRPAGWLRPATPSLF